jgi:hypothetical protein
LWVQHALTCPSKPQLDCIPVEDIPFTYSWKQHSTELQMSLPQISCQMYIIFISVCTSIWLYFKEGMQNNSRFTTKEDLVKMAQSHGMCQLKNYRSKHSMCKTNMYHPKDQDQCFTKDCVMKNHLQSSDSTHLIKDHSPSAWPDSILKVFLHRSIVKSKHISKETGEESKTKS